MHASTTPTILVVDDEPSHRRLVGRWLECAEHDAVTAASAEEALSRLSAILPDAILMDLHMDGMGGMEALRRLRKLHPDVPVIMLTGDSSVPAAVEAMQEGAWDYLLKPVERPKLLTTVRNALEKAELQARVRQLERSAGGDGYGDIKGRSPIMERLFQQLDRLAPSDITVLIQGESGTGKELIARALHQHSGRAEGPFVAINCAAIPESLQESELFGHEKGAFTGATSTRIGRFEQAQGGTLFLDEIGELSPGLQAKLLRVLQERRLYRVGGTSERHIDVRILAAGHHDLSERVRAGTFREDLFYRLAVFELVIPPLRERTGDIEILGYHFLREAAQRYHNGMLEIDPGAAAVLEGYSWPGNVRELHNALERAAVVAIDGVIRAGDLPPRIRNHRAGDTPMRDQSPPTPMEAPPPEQDGLRPMERLERDAIAAALRRSNGNVSEVIRVLGIPRTSLYRKLKRYGLRA